ncbi:DUF3429 domain-containing protein [Bordetella sp. FB-8]|uniref:DUF3429 domain-containing protein n=1 Tax=Bordetella sp. FB-8 TaxID=1159870 RepID=UPI00035E7EF5|nr:DUF3429 domain-containing protein [Bordetella sp. FB-8]
MHDPNRELPACVVWLGYGGLLPFVGTAVLTRLDPQSAELWFRALIGYGAVILSFVGALHWGFAMVAAGLDAHRRDRAYGWSVVPALLAWPALLLPPRQAALLLMLGFVLHLVQDHRLARRTALPDWYLPLRWRLTIVASLSLLAGAWMGMAHA